MDYDCPDLPSAHGGAHACDNPECPSVTRLAAAAPYMLQVLRGIVAALTQNATFPADVEYVRIHARAAIARATAPEVPA